MRDIKTPRAITALYGVELYRRSADAPGARVDITVRAILKFLSDHHAHDRDEDRANNNKKQVVLMLHSSPATLVGSAQADVLGL